jgi:predicted dehydrogenase
MKIGIISTGNISNTGHAPAIKSLNGSELTAVYSRDLGKGKDFLAQHGYANAAAYNTIEDFVSDKNIELAIICSPDGLHYEQTKKCLIAGMHVLVEKPMTLEEDQAIELVSLARSKNLSLATGFHHRSHVGLRALKNQILEGRIGELRHIRIIWAWPAKDNSNWRSELNYSKWWSLSAVGSHCIDLARWFNDDMDDWIKFNSTLTNNIWNGPHDETAMLTAQFGNGVTLDVCSSVQFGPYNRIEIYGSKGSAICDNSLGREGAGEINICGEKLEFSPVNPFAAQLNNIINHIENGEALNADAQTGERSVKDLNCAL